MAHEKLSVAATIAHELKVTSSQIDAAIRLLDDGATVPFIARYRKEATEGLNDVQLRILAERLHYLRELNERRQVVLKSIREQEKLTLDLEQAILAADSKTRLEDLYLPFRPKRHTKAQIAKEAGLEPLANALLNDSTLNPEEVGSSYIKPEAGVNDIMAALEGARQILMEKFAEDPDLLEEMRRYVWQHAVLTSSASKAKKNKNNNQDQKFSDYFAYAEPIKKIPSHRALALFRGRREGVLQLALALTDDEVYGVTRLIDYFKITAASQSWLHETLRQTWKVKIWSKLELEALARLRELADEEAIRVFASNLRDLLLAAPAGPKITIGLDPGIRTGVKVVVVDATGKLLDYTTIFPLAPHNDWHPALAELAKLAAKYHVNLISIGNGTGSRETERLVNELIKMYPDLQLTKMVVSEAGASVYSASEIAAQEFPDLDVSLRGAVSIARRLQDPLAELVKIEPKSIGVGQYQHDVNPARLARGLDAVVEDCVNIVGVDVNTASVPLLSRISGLNEALAKNLVQYRNEHGAFSNREQFKHVPRMGEKTYQQCAGFLRIMQGDNPLDASGVHPETYQLVEKIAANNQLEIKDIVGAVEQLRQIKIEQYADEQFGLPTIRDVLHELEKPGRDPRPQFKTVNFKEGVEEITHLEIGMLLEGIVSNVTNFGAFVDIGVHQDGLVHISEMTHRFISDPRALVKAGQVVQVRVIEVDKERRRISLSMKLSQETAVTTASTTLASNTPKNPPIQPQKVLKKTKSSKPVLNKKPASQKAVFNTAMADALTKLKLSTK